MANSFQFSIRDLLVTTLLFSIFGGMCYVGRFLRSYTDGWSEPARTMVFVPYGIMFFVVLGGAIGSLFGKTKAGLLCGLAIGAIEMLAMSVIGLDAIRE